MKKAISSDLMIVALELRLAARETGQVERRLTEQRLLELADIVEAAVLQIDTHDLRREVTALTALGHRSR